MPNYTQITTAVDDNSSYLMALNFLRKVFSELGLVSLWTSPLDTKLLCTQRFVRLFAYGGSTLILVAYLAALGISKAQIGLFMTLTLLGDVLISFALTLCADALGRKAILALGAVLMAGSGVVFALAGNYWVLLLAAILGVISPRYVSFACWPKPVLVRGGRCGMRRG